jgi:hypothetical protein
LPEKPSSSQSSDHAPKVSVLLVSLEAILLLQAFHAVISKILNRHLLLSLSLSDKATMVQSLTQILSIGGTGNTWAYAAAYHQEIAAAILANSEVA